MGLPLETRRVTCGASSALITKAEIRQPPSERLRFESDVGLVGRSRICTRAKRPSSGCLLDGLLDELHESGCIVGEPRHPPHPSQKTRHPPADRAANRG